MEVLKACLAINQRGILTNTEYILAACAFERAEIAKAKIDFE
jgi:hypothetical protein